MEFKSEKEELEWLRNTYSKLIWAEIKETPQKVIPSKIDETRGACPECRCVVLDTDNYCRNCGQKLSWES